MDSQVVVNVRVKHSIYEILALILKVVVNLLDLMGVHHLNLCHPLSLLILELLNILCKTFINFYKILKLTLCVALSIILFIAL